MLKTHASQNILLTLVQHIHEIRRRYGREIKKEKVSKTEGLGGIDMIRHLLTCKEINSSA